MTSLERATDNSYFNQILDSKIIRSGSEELIKVTNIYQEINKLCEALEGFTAALAKIPARQVHEVNALFDSFLDNLAGARMGPGAIDVSDGYIYERLNKMNRAWADILEDRLAAHHDRDISGLRVQTEANVLGLLDA